jgi:hypothetical protein
LRRKDAKYPLQLSASEFRHVEARTDVTSERTGGVVQRPRVVQNRAVFAVTTAKPILNHERLTLIEGPVVCFQAMLQICGMDTTCPPIAELRVERSSREVKPLFIEIGAPLVGAGNPDQQRKAVRHEPEQFVAIALC